MIAHRVPLKPLGNAFPYVALVLSGSLCVGGCNTAPPTYTLSGTVVNLAATGGGLVLQDNSQNNLSVNANGSFTFSTPVPSGSSYSVTIFSQPSNPTQICGVTNGSGTVTGNVTNIQVNCGHNEWAWVTGASGVSATGVYGTQGSPGMNNTPGPRQQPLSWTDASGDFWLFGGQLWISTSRGYALMNDLWKYSGGQWTWVAGSNVGPQNGTYGTLGVTAPTNSPGSRCQAVGWSDSSGNLWLFGGEGYDSAGNEGTLNDLWKFSAGEWTWMGGSDLVNQPATYGTLGIANASNIPSARLGAVSWIDSSSGDFWLFGGFHESSNGNSSLNDLWKYSNGEWAWESGSQAPNANGVYGMRGVPAPGNVPGARIWSVGSIDSSGRLWLFGGAGYPPTGPAALLNDLWEYSNGQWVWMSGSTTVDQPGVYGTQGVPAASNAPGSRQLALSWADSGGNFWLFGGNGIDSANGEGLLNDLWKYSNGQWTWVSGAKIINQNGVYGSQTMLAPGNIPGAREEPCGWIDASGNLWLFGGYGVPPSGSEGNLNDLWIYMP